MNVKELMDALSTLDPETTVLAHSTYGDSLVLGELVVLEDVDRKRIDSDVTAETKMCAIVHEYFKVWLQWDADKRRVNEGDSQ